MQPQGCFESVANVYRFSKCETTNAHYGAFLDALAATETHALYESKMNLSIGGITRSIGSSSCVFAASDR